MNEMLKDRSGNIIGHLRQSGDRIYLYNRSGTILGYHETRSEFTYDAGGVMIGKGNLLPLLLRF